MIGGVESITMTLAEGLANWPKTHGETPVEVTVATNTPAGAMDDSRLPFRVIRKPNLRVLVSLIRSADIVHLAGPTLLPLLLGYLLWKTVVVEHHGYQSVCRMASSFMGRRRVYVRAISWRDVAANVSYVDLTILVGWQVCAARSLRFLDVGCARESLETLP